MKDTKKLRKGFTLVELIVVIAIIAILAAVSVAGYYGFIASANQSAADQEAAQIKNVLILSATNGKTINNLTYSYDNNGIKVTKGSDYEEVDPNDDIFGAFQGMLEENGINVNIENDYDSSVPDKLNAYIILLNAENFDATGSSFSMDNDDNFGYVTSLVYVAKNTYKSLVKFTNN